MINIKTILVAFVLVATFFGCVEETVILPESTDGVMPLKTGNQWIFRTYLVDTTGTLTDEYYDTLTVHGTEVFKNALWYDMSGDGTYYLANRTDGLWRRDYGTTLEHIAKMPAQRGEAYTAMYYTNPDNDSVIAGFSMYRVMATDTTITTPAGTFSCYAYTDVSGDPQRYTHMWFYSEGIGFIKETAVSLSSQENWGSELVGYNFK